MEKELLLHFQLLKKDIEEKYKKEYPECRIIITNWRQQEIKRLRSLLVKHVGGQISEKWFYTHIRTENNEKLPRIDTLDLLCRFVGFENWEQYLEFKRENVKTTSTKKRSFLIDLMRKKKWLVIGISIIFFGLVIFTNVDLFAQLEYRFSFIDADTGELIKNSKIEITILHPNESPELIMCDSNASFTYQEKQTKISFIANAQYYKADTITRVLDKKRFSEEEYLKTVTNIKQDIKQGEIY